MTVRTRKPISRCGCQGGSLACGAQSTYRAGCGCDPCVDAHRERINANAARRREAQNAGTAIPDVGGKVRAQAIPRARRGQPERLVYCGTKKAVDVWRPLGWAPSDRDLQESGPEWREKNLGPWCFTHRDWALRPMCHPGPDHSAAAGRGECKWAD